MKNPIKDLAMSRIKKYEHCIFCGNYVKIKYTIPTNERKYYIDGAGQLCEKCYKSIYKTI